MAASKDSDTQSEDGRRLGPEAQPSPGTSRRGMLRRTSPFVPNSVDESALMVKVHRAEGKYGCRPSPFRGRLLPQLPRCQAGSQDSVVGMNIRLCVCSTQLGTKHLLTAERSHDRGAQFRLVPCKFGLLSPPLAFDFPMTNSARESSKHEGACSVQISSTCMFVCSIYIFGTSCQETSDVQHNLSR